MLATMASPLPRPLLDVVERSAASGPVGALFGRLLQRRPDIGERLAEESEATNLGRTVAAVAAASNSLGRLIVADDAALDVLADVEQPVALDARDADALARSKHLALLRIAARDLLGLDSLDSVGVRLADLATDVLRAAVALACGPDSADIGVIGMGKLGGRELNYSSDVDVLFVGAAGIGDEQARRILDVARGCFRVDADLRPEGRAGPLVRTLDGYRSYWQRWAQAWEFQALLKARPVAGDAGLGDRFAELAGEQVWGRTFSADELAAMRAMKARTEALVQRRGLDGRELKRGPGGIRDVEFAVQLLQLVHGRLDPAIRDRSTLGALAELAAAGYVATHDADTLGRSYRFLRTVEHRVQLVEEEQIHAVPPPGEARDRLARVLGFEAGPGATAGSLFEDALHRCQADVRTIHERLFFRPLLEAFATVEGGDTGVGMTPSAVATRLAAFGFAGAERTGAAVAELASGLTRSSRLMTQLLPLLLDWLSMTPDPDLGLLGLRNLVVHVHPRALVVSAFRESPEIARRLCILLGTSRVLGEAVVQNPALIAELDDDVALRRTTRSGAAQEARQRLRTRFDEAQRRAQLRRFWQETLVRTAMRDLLGLDDVADTGAALAAAADGLLDAALESCGPTVPFCVVGLGALGGSELSYASDLDVLFVCEDESPGMAVGEALGESLLRLIHGPTAVDRVVTLDLNLRPEGALGRLVRDVEGYASYFDRWAQTWERQAMLRARVVAGDAELGRRFCDVVERFVTGRSFTDEDAADIRRMKARIERERIPPREDPQFHLKLGRGSLSDVEWTVQLLQLRHGVAAAGTLQALDDLVEGNAIAADDADALRDAYRFCMHTRNRWYLVGALPGGASPGDSLPSPGTALSHLARSLTTTPSALRDDYRRVTRRARRVMERLFYGLDR